MKYANTKRPSVQSHPRESFAPVDNPYVSGRASPDALTDRGRALAAMGHHREAVHHFRAALAVDVDYPAAHINLGRTAHMIGDSTLGWEEFKWHFHPGSLRWRAFEQPLWDGGTLRGRTLLLWADHGLGDTIQFLRCVQTARASQARVIVECDCALVPLAERVEGIDRVIARGAPLPPFDAHAPLLLVASLLPSSTPSSGHVPYLTTDERLIKAWRRRLGPYDGLTIGVRWAGGHERSGLALRDAPLTAFSTLAEIPRVRLVALQLGRQTNEALDAPDSWQLATLLNPACTIADTAALILALDLVITTDTMVAHLAGGLGQPVWVLLRCVCDWRWRETGTDTPWYPTMRLFRQGREGSWDGVFRSVAAALGSEVVGASATPAQELAETNTQAHEATSR